MESKNMLIPIILAAISGSLMAIQGSFNSALGKVIGFVESALVVQITGAIVTGFLLLFMYSGQFSRLGEAPWFAWLGGLVGVGIVLGVMVSISKLGMGISTAAIIAAQLLTAYTIDHFGWFGVEQIPFSACKFCGIALIVIGAKLLF